jgi:hypothetical protein
MKQSRRANACKRMISAGRQAKHEAGFDGFAVLGGGQVTAGTRTGKRKDFLIRSSSMLQLRRTIP